MSETVERFRITGVVQGVFYRKWAQATAEGFGLRGFVRNMADGSVEAMLGGPQGRLDAFAEACCSGPPDARVEAVERFETHVGELGGGDGVEIADDG